MLVFFTINLLVVLIPGDIPRLDQINIDGRVLSFTLLLSLLTGMVFGLVPACYASRPDVHRSLKEGSGASASPGPHRLRNLMAISEIALALTLLIGAGLLIQRFVRLLEQKPGFHPENLMTMQLSLPRYKYRSASQRMVPGREKRSRFDSALALSEHRMRAEAILAEAERRGPHRPAVYCDSAARIEKLPRRKRKQPRFP